ncbi:protein TonB [Rhodovulum bhavnagarense]|uniref:Protein TonB n=1 Tax=Rhodovulum bhavnagarense TaxID=992286 RepID=A0A4R2REL0_9RHOB|nr:TonB family protein [Rhodovulum bhavnagarense]TCP61960.1 protein TonB [Rhodovulum bhavnagarense]
MRRLLDIALFVPLAAGIHVAAFGIASGPMGGAPGAGGAGGEDLVTLAAAPHSMAELARDWARQPAAQTDLAVPDRPQAAQAPRLPDAERMAAPVREPARPARPELGEVPPVAEMPPRPSVSRRNASLPGPREAPHADGPSRPDHAPDIASRSSPPPVTRNAPASEPQQARRAKGTEAVPQAGQAARAAAAPSLSSAMRGQLRAEWGGQILGRVTRHHRYPRGATAQGVALVELVVDREGNLVSARLLRSAGDATLDRAALATVHRASPFPKAPDGLDRARDSFAVPLRYERR